MRAQGSTSYRPDIDGLRAVAVVSVVVFHAWPTLLPGGFVGVDVFFVISGYLISSIVFSEIDAGRFSFVRFYARRIRRIFPALLIVLIASLAAGWAFLLVDEFANLGKYAAGAAAFSANLVAWSDAGYFDTAAELKPLLHLWSLGIEEQFYMVWPFAAVLIFRTGASRFVVLALIAAASFWLSVRFSTKFPASAFYLPITRAWELLAGSLLATVTLRRDHFKFVGSDARSIVGIGMICAATVIANREMSFPGWIALMPVVGTVLAISAGKDAWINRRILGSRPFVFVGLISYPLYLWHLPLLVFPRIIEAEMPSVTTRLLLVAAACVLAWLTYVLLERPARAFQRQFLPVALGTVMVFVGLAGWSAVATGGFPGRLPAEVQALRNDTDITAEWRHHRCYLGDGDGPDKFSSECIDPGPANAPLMFLWGDSHAAALYPGLKKVNQGGFRLGQFTASACGPLIPSTGGNPNCPEINARVLEIVATQRPKAVILHAIWTSLHYDVQGLRRTIMSLRESGVRKVIVLGSVPIWTDGLPKHLALAFRRDGKLPARSIPDMSRNVESELKLIAQETGAVFVSMADILCDGPSCLTLIGGHLSAFDTAHLTPTAAEFVAKALRPSKMIHDVR